MQWRANCDNARPPLHPYVLRTGGAERRQRGLKVGVSDTDIPLMGVCMQLPLLCSM